jgi:2-keto-4-pentenoate hydratase/2-oxohepta-3-ene-1,7-dioic acid hydratase in catechol pathway
LSLSGLPKIEYSSVRIACPIKNPSKIVGIGLNYADHAAETNLKLKNEPIIFMKSTSALQGPNDKVHIPIGAEKLDYEAELAVIVGRKAKNIPENEAHNYILGYSIMNDYSERAYQIERGGQWTKGKSSDGFAPLGPYILTKDEIDDVQNLNIWLRLNGNIMQDSTTKNMLYSVNYLLSYVSRFMTLLPGDIITTGTPSGVGMGQNPPRFLRKGDEIELGISNLGIQKQEII